jgi:hypothetical protein
MPEIITNVHAQENGHWYDKNGKEAHSYINKKGEEKPTTLRQARTEGLVPSVTSIIRLAAAPGLDAWKADQVIMAALSLPRVPDETDDEFVARIKLDAKEQAKKAAEKGTLIHAFVQTGFEGMIITGDDARIRYYESARKTIHAALGFDDSAFDCEKSFARDGYGGKVDLSRDGIVIDIKSTTKPLEGLKTWDEHSLQLSAYRHGLGMDDARCFILYIHTETAESKLIELDSKELEKGFKMFVALKDYFYAKTSLGV